jgi:hypothetical protein
MSLGVKGALRLLGVAAIAAGAAGLACGRGPAPVRVASVRVADGALAGPLREAGLDAAALEEAARAALGDAGFRLDPREGAFRARLDVLAVRIAPDAAGNARAEISVELALAPAAPGGAEGAREEGTGTAALAGRLPPEAWRGALAVATGAAAKGLAIGFAARAKPVDALLRDLGAPDPRTRDHAVRALAERRSPEAVPALVERLRDDDPEIAHRAVGALAQIGDRRAVGPLIDLAQRGDPPLTARIARIIGDLGGPEAEGYLLTLEAGHGEARVRRAAREALDEMRARSERGAVASGG